MELIFFIALLVVRSKNNLMIWNKHSISLQNKYSSENSREYIDNSKFSDLS